MFFMNGFALTAPSYQSESTNEELWGGNFARIRETVGVQSQGITC